MCGVYGIFHSKSGLSGSEIRHFAAAAQVRGVDSSGIAYKSDGRIKIKKRDFGSVELIGEDDEYSVNYCYL